MSGSPSEVAKTILRTPAPTQGLPQGVRAVGMQIGKIYAVDNTAYPWTVTVQLPGPRIDGTLNLIDDVSYLVSGYTPVVGQRVILLVSGTDRVAIGSPGPLSGAGGAQSEVDSGPSGSAVDIAFSPSGAGNTALTLQNDPAATEGLAVLGLDGQVALGSLNGGDLSLGADNLLLRGSSGIDLRCSAGDVIIDAVQEALQFYGGDVVYNAINSPPAIEDLDPGDFAPWLDDTVGATIFHIFALDASGSIVDLPLGGAGGVVPIGAMLAFPNSYSDGLIPTAWLLCNGASFSSIDYPDLATYLSGTVLPNLTQPVTTTIARVQSAGTGTVAAAASTTTAVTLTGVAVGHGLIVEIAQNLNAGGIGTVSSVSDGVNTYHQATGAATVTASGKTAADLWYCKSVTTGGSLTITVTFTVAAGGLLTVTEVMGQDPVLFFDKVGSASGTTSTTPSATAGATTAANDFCVAFCNLRGAQVLATSPAVSTALVTTTTETLANDTATAVKGALTTIDGVIAASAVAETFTAANPANDEWSAIVASFLSTTGASLPFYIRAL